MSQPRKKHSMEKRKQAMARHLVKDIVVCFVDNMPGCKMYHRKRKQLFLPSAAVAHAAAGVPHKWSCYLAVFGRTPYDEYFKGEQLFVDQPYVQSALVHTFIEHHGELAKRVPDHQLCGVGWIADPNGNKLSEKEAGHSFTLLEAWS